MKVTVIMPTVRTQWIRESIKSFLMQDYDSELLVINDGTDNDYEGILKEFDSNRIRYFKKNAESIGYAMNFGLEKATGELITALHDDDTLTINSLKCRAEALKEYDVVWAANTEMNLQGVIGDKKDPAPPDKNRIWKQDYVNWTTLMWRKSIHDKIGLFAKMSHDEDWHFKIRCIMECNCTTIPDVVTNYRIHSGQYSAIGREAGITKKEEARMWDEMKARYNK